jgi:hypothetical protein
MKIVVNGIEYECMEAARIKILQTMRKKRLSRANRSVEDMHSHRDEDGSVNWSYVAALYLNACLDLETH